MSRTARRLVLWCAVCALALSTACDFSAKLQLYNRTGDTLTPYPVDLDLEPPRRVADTANNVAAGDTTGIDPAGPNPVFYRPGITDETKANGVFLGLNLVDADPMQIQYKLFHYRVPPGEAGKDPDLQPILLLQDVVDVEDVNTQVAVSAPDGSPTGWAVRVIQE